MCSETAGSARIQSHYLVNIEVLESISFGSGSKDELEIALFVAGTCHRERKKEDPK